MPNHKRLGLIIMTAALFLGAASILLSSGWQAGIDFIPMLVYFLKLQLFGESDDYLIDISTKYAVLSCMCVFAIGFLVFVGAIRKSTIQTTEGTAK